MSATIAARSTGANFARTALLRLGVDDAILDDEVIAADATGRPQLYDLSASARDRVYGGSSR